MRLALSSPTGAAGSGEIAWDGPRYRETRSSAGLSIVRGIQSRKAYFTDEDGITRVASEPVLAELTTRSYFWRHAWLFDDLEQAKIGLAPVDGARVSVSLVPRGGSLLVLTFSRDGGRLLSARAPGFAVSFRDERHFRDESAPGRAFEAEVRWIGLPVAALPDAAVGGWLARWEAASAEAELQKSGRALLFPARISGIDARVALDADADGPLRVSPALAARLRASWDRDVLGRRVARGASLQLGAVSFPGLSVEESVEAGGPSSDARVGGVVLRESILELDPQASRLRLHDPARWAAPDGFFRVVLDDDGNRAVGVWNRGSKSVRLLVGVPLGTSLSLAPAAIERLGLSVKDRSVSGFRWGAAHLPALDFTVDRSIDSDWGEDGRIGMDVLLRFHVYLDLPRRWVYLRPLAP
jgi:hypothetical protein